MTRTAASSACAQVSLGTRQIGDGAPVFITMEAGPTHDGLDSAKRLIELAAQAGADAVKFQIFDPDRLVADKQQLFEYEVLVDRESGRTERVSEPLYDILARRCLSPDQWRQVKAHADALGLAFFSTVGFAEDVALLEDIGCQSYKIASADINHLPLIRQVARTGKPVQIDTGSATIGEVESAVDAILAQGNEQIIIHHCPSGYPAHIASINLRVIATLKRLFRLPVAFSDHSPGWDMDMAAIALGADMVEKTITEDRMTRSVEHVMSLEPRDMKAFVVAVRRLETALGAPRRVMTAEERQKALAVRRSAHVKRDLEQGHVIVPEDLDFRRPGYGIAPDRLDEIVGRKLARKVARGEALAWTDLAS